MFGKESTYNGIDIKAGLSGVDAQRGPVKIHYDGNRLLQMLGPLVEQDMLKAEKEQETQA